MNRSLKPAGILDPLKESLILPEVVDDKKWIGGFDDGYMDNEKKYVLGFAGDIQVYVWVKRDLIADKKLKSIEEKSLQNFNQN